MTSILWVGSKSILAQNYRDMVKKFSLHIFTLWLITITFNKNTDDILWTNRFLAYYIHGKISIPKVLTSEEVDVWSIWTRGKTIPHHFTSVKKMACLSIWYLLDSSLPAVSLDSSLNFDLAVVLMLCQQHLHLCHVLVLAPKICGTF